MREHTFTDKELLVRINREEKFLILISKFNMPKTINDTKNKLARLYAEQMRRQEIDK